MKGRWNIDGNTNNGGDFALVPDLSHVWQVFDHLILPVKTVTIRTSEWNKWREPLTFGRAHSSSFHSHTSFISRTIRKHTLSAALLQLTAGGSTGRHTSLVSTWLTTREKRASVHFYSQVCRWKHCGLRWNTSQDRVSDLHIISLPGVLPFLLQVRPANQSNVAGKHWPRVSFSMREGRRHVIFVDRTFQHHWVF